MLEFAIKTHFYTSLVQLDCICLDMLILLTKFWAIQREQTPQHWDLYLLLLEPFYNNLMQVCILHLWGNYGAVSCNCMWIAPYWISVKRQFTSINMSYSGHKGFLAYARQSKQNIFYTIIISFIHSEAQNNGFIDRCVWIAHVDSTPVLILAQG